MVAVDRFSFLPGKLKEKRRKKNSPTSYFDVLHRHRPIRPATASRDVTSATSQSEVGDDTDGLVCEFSAASEVALRLHAPLRLRRAGGHEAWRSGWVEGC